jgi:hypothetical protein
MTDDFRGQGLDARAGTWDRRDGMAGLWAETTS